ncbi:MAG: hypothetical protein NWR21_05590 [Verrucomicrobiales bacterium]|nr:hypothetical protein [Verrucomicrobiales bacterium]
MFSAFAVVSESLHRRRWGQRRAASAGPNGKRTTPGVSVSLSEAEAAKARIDGAGK